MTTITMKNGYETIVCDCHAHLVTGRPWYVSKSGYAMTRLRIHESDTRKMVSMHRMILNPRPGRIADHRDGNRLNNQCSNLREATYLQNGANRDKSSRNTSGFKGVTWHKSANRWMAQIKRNRKNINLGLYKTAQDAALAYNDAALRLDGEYARLNKI